MEIIEQRSLKNWPLGLDYTLAILPLEPFEITARHGLTFEADHDDLDLFIGCYLNFKSDLIVLRKYYRAESNLGTELLVFHDHPNKQKVLEKVLKFFNLTTEQLRWIRTY